MRDLIKPREGTVEWNSGFEYLHGVDEDKVANFESVFKEKGWDLPPLLLADYPDFYVVIDGHHRIEAAKRLQWPEPIPALIVEGAEFECLLEDEFGGKIPKPLSKLDKFFDLPSGSGKIAKLGLDEDSIVRIAKALR
jgi:hypothetical protein